MWAVSSLIFLGLVTSQCYGADDSNSPTTSKRILCFYTNWAPYRQGLDKYTPKNIDPYLCTHLIYAYASLSNEKGLVSFDPYQDIELNGFKKFTALKSLNPNLKTMIAVGGGNDISNKFGPIVRNPVLRNKLVRNSVEFLRKYDFDGLELVWKYPGGDIADKEIYLQLVKELREEFYRDAAESGKPELILSMIVPFQIPLMDRSFDLTELEKYLDYMTVLTYDYHSPKEHHVNHFSPLYSLPGDEQNKELNIDATVKEYIQRGVNPQKMNIAFGLYGTIYKLEDPQNNRIGSKSVHEGYGNERGFIFYNMLCRKIIEENWTVRHENRTAMGPYAFKGKNWISFDDEDAIRNKAKYALEHQLGGLTFWAIDQDDFNGLCHGKKYPLIRAAIEEFLNKA